MRISWEIEQKIFPHERREIDLLRPRQIGVNGEIVDDNLERKFFKTTDAVQFDRLSQFALDPERSLRDADVQLKAKRPGTTRFFAIKLGQGTILLTFQVQTFSWNLTQMNFHSRILSKFIV